MIEMTETANICHHATAQSLVILDEIGRGTSTLDGLSLAWSIAEFLAGKRCRTLFATHYHELTELADRYENVTNLNVTVREWQDQIVFLHRIVAGATDRSYGIHVAKIAGLPVPVVQRANELLSQLAVNHQPAAAAGATTQAGSGASGGGGGASVQPPGQSDQFPLFTTQFAPHPALEQLRETDLDNLTPIQAFDLLRKLRAELE
jgi:DNA mismatch repair protein MutS